MTIRSTSGLRAVSSNEEPIREADGPYVPAAGRAVLTPIYDLAMRTMMREGTFRARLVKQTLTEFSDGELLDLGCGTGTFSIAAADLAPTVRVTGLDGDLDVLAAARRKDSGGRVVWMQGLATRLPFADGRFGRVVASLLLHHLSDQDKHRALQEARRVLRRDGQLHICDWGSPRGLIPRAGFTLLRAIDGRANTRVHARGEIPELMRAAGFRSRSLTARLPTVWGTLELWRATLT